MHDEVIHGVGMRDVEKMTRSGDDAIGFYVVNRNQTITTTMHVVDGHR